MSTGIWGRSTRTYRYETAEDTKQICRSRTRWWMEAECQRSKEANRVETTQTAKLLGKAKAITKVQASQRHGQTGSDTPSPFAIYQASPLLTPWVQEGSSNSTDTASATSSSSTVNNELLAAVAKAFPDKSQMPEELRDLVDKANLQSSKSITKDLHSATSSLGKSKKLLQEVVEAKRAHKQAWTHQFTCRIPRALAKAVTRLHATTGDIGRKRKQSHSRYTDCQQEYTKPQPASSGYRWPTRGLGTSAAQQSGSLHAEGQRDDRSPEETSKVLWRMHGGSRQEGGQRSCRGDLGIRRRRGAEEEEAKITRATGRCIVIQGRVSMCQTNRRHAGHVKFNPLVEAYGDNGKHHAAGLWV